MDDRKILELFFERSQSAIDETRAKYGDKLCRLAENILGSYEDAEECVNDTYLGAWNSIPPKEPEPLLPYLYRITRNIAITRFHRTTAKKRGGPGFDAAFDELEDVLVSTEGIEDEFDTKELSKLVNDFLKELPQRDRILFMGRYWYGEAYDTLALRLNISENNCAVRVSRIRHRLRNYLEKKGAL